MYGDRTQHNYTAITVDFEYCFETSSKEDCLTDEEVERFIDSGQISFLLQMEYKQLNMQNQDDPLENAFVMH